MKSIVDTVICVPVSVKLSLFVKSWSEGRREGRREEGREGGIARGRDGYIMTTLAFTWEKIIYIKEKKIC